METAHTVKELIDILAAVEDKDLPVCAFIFTGVAVTHFNKGMDDEHIAISEIEGD